MTLPFWRPYWIRHLSFSNMPILSPEVPPKRSKLEGTCKILIIQVVIEAALKTIN